MLGQLSMVTNFLLNQVIINTLHGTLQLDDFIISWFLILNHSVLHTAIHWLNMTYTVYKLCLWFHILRVNVYIIFIPFFFNDTIKTKQIKTIKNNVKIKNIYIVIYCDQECWMLWWIQEYVDDVGIWYLLLFQIGNYFSGRELFQ